MSQEINNQNQEQKKSESLMDSINDFLFKFSHVPLKEKLFFTQYLGIMLRAGISLSKALNTLSRQTTNKFFSKILIDISANVERGASFSNSLKKYEKIFGELFINMIEAGEISGKLEEVLQQLYIQMKKNHELISRVKGALTYPAVIIFAMGGIGTFMMIMVVPKLTDMLKSFGAELPLATKVIVGVSDFIVNNGLLVVVGFVIFIAIIVKIWRTHVGKYFIQAFFLKIPVIGLIIKKINLAKFSRNISSLLKTDIMIIKTFNITANTLGNLHYRKVVIEMAEKINKGSKINEVASLYPSLFPPVVSQIMAVGEETGELDEMLAELAAFYENEVDRTMENLPAIIEPILILVLGVGVGLMAMAIIMPIYSMTMAI